MKSPYNYSILVPSGASEGRKYPAVFALHGIGYTDEDMLSLLQDLREEFIIVAVRGNLTYEDGYAFYYLKEYGKPVRELFDEAVTKMQTFIDYATATYPIDENQRFLCGFSQGAILSATLGRLLGSRIRGIAALHGYVPDFLDAEFTVQSLEDVDVLVAHGSFDAVFPETIGHKTYEYMRERARSVKYIVYPSEHEVTSDHQSDLLAWFRQQVNQATKSSTRALKP
ncbi:alpha/beta hydrolase [Alicyclobacillus herbarius]|uniref:alpha/beta hydrolase n=1 Tax=Alicyclobacillus herbarius TaxID=122960 RepID=UPI0004112B43|nr:alpha/beta hydrolase-fold protein [Alicyclobacillus herbarius]